MIVVIILLFGSLVGASFVEPLFDVKTEVVVPPTTQSPGIETDAQCSLCNYTTLWNDVILVIDNSDVVSTSNMEDMLSALQSQLGFLSIQGAIEGQDKFHTRMGLVTYNSTATLQYPLGTLNTTSLSNMELTSGGGLPNLQAGIQTAIGEFESSKNKRSNARSVMLILTNSYYQFGSSNPMIIADEFKASNGVIIVYDYALGKLVADPVLQSIASSGYYYISGQDRLGDNMLNGLCNANCFCPANTIAYLRDDDNATPIGGCYFSNGGIFNKVLAKKKCAQYNDGFIALDKTKNKTLYLRKEMNRLLSDSYFWIGLTYDSELKQYFWDDGTMLHEDYKPFIDYKDPITASAGSVDCVYVDGTGWVQTDCRNSRMFVCEQKQCDSVTYCD